MPGGDPSFDAFVRERYEQLLRYAVMLTGRRADAEEVVQEALLRCLTRWRRVPADNAVAYARKAIYHEFLRTVKRKPPVPLEDHVDRLDVADFAGAVEDRQQVLRVLVQLPATLRDPKD